MVLLYSRRLESSELNLVKLVEFMGGEVELVDLESVADSNCLRRNIPVSSHIIVRASTLAEIVEKGPFGKDSLELLAASASDFLVYGFEATLQHSQLLRTLTNGGIA